MCEKKTFLVSAARPGKKEINANNGLRLESMGWQESAQYNDLQSKMKGSLR